MTSKRGRPKKPGRRQKNGRLTRQAREAMQEDPAEVAIQARMRVFGISREEAMGKARKNATENEKLQAKMEERMGVNWGHSLGRAHKRGYITQAQFVAGRKFAEHMRDYMLSKGIGAPTPAAFDPLRRGASLTDGKVKHESEAKEYLAALAEVDRANVRGRSATFIVMDICLRDASEHLSELERGIFREGLNAIGRVIDHRERMARKAA